MAAALSSCMGEPPRLDPDGRARRPVGRVVHVHQGRARRRLAARRRLGARSSSAALVLLPIAHRARRAGRRCARTPGRSCCSSVVQVAAPFLLITFGEKHIASALAGILVPSAPIFTALLAVRIDREELAHGWALVGDRRRHPRRRAAVRRRPQRATRQRSLGGADGAAGEPRLRDRPAPDEAQAPGRPPVGIAAATMTLAALAADAAVSRSPAPTHAPGSTPSASLLVLGAGGTGIAFLIFYTLIAEVGPGRATVVAYIAPGVQRRLRRAAARRDASPPAPRRPAADPRPARGWRPAARAQPKRTFPFERARACARSMKSRRLSAARSSRVTSRSRAFSERRLEQALLGLQPEVDRRGHLVGAHRLERARARARCRSPARRASRTPRARPARSRRRAARPCRRATRPSRPGRAGRPGASTSRNGRVPRVRMFIRPSSMALEHLGDLAGAADRRSPSSDSPDDPELRLRPRGTRRSSSGSAPRRCAAARPRVGSATMPAGRAGSPAGPRSRRVYAGVRPGHEDRIPRDRDDGRADGAQPRTRRT